MKRVVSKLRSFEEADEATRAYYLGLSPADRLEILFQLRDFMHTTDRGIAAFARTTPASPPSDADGSPVS
jgi:hypothetical protein